ncbi:MAG: response regulator [Armatimonadota bacterium]
MPRVLVVDDDPSLREVLSQGLEEAGMQTDTAEGGRTALQALCRATADQNPYDAMVLDIVMPDINGWQVLEAVRSNPLWRDMPVVAISGFANATDDVARVSDYGAFFVEKDGDFLSVIRSAITRLVDAA